MPLIRRPLFFILLSSFWLGGSALVLHGQSHNISSARAGLLEVGSPLFSVLSKESLGLDSAPTDIHILPDGRTLLVAGHQLAFGDGVRWTVINQFSGDEASRALTVAVDASGTIYQAIQGGFARVEFREDDTWRLVRVADWPAEETTQRTVPRYVIKVGDEWFWHHNSGSIISWQPGQAAKSMGTTDTVAHIFTLRDHYYLCSWSIGTVEVLPKSGTDPRLARTQVLTDSYITSAQPWNDHEVLVGSTLEGLQLFDGQTLRPFSTSGALSAGHRINSICRTDGGYFAAAVENHGVVFFDQAGRIIQNLDRSLDHRLSRVLLLIPGRNGIVWGLLTDGIIRVEFPSRVSHYEPIFNTGLSTIHPFRSEGRLWLMADNRVLRADYEADGRLTGFTVDSPPNQSVFALSCEPGPGLPIAGGENGGYYRDESGWKLFAPGVRYLRVLQNKPVDGQWLYCAENEIGWLRRSGSGYEISRYPVPGLGRVFNSNTDGQGNVWLELGTGLVGRIHPGQPDGEVPRFETYDTKRGILTGWAQIFVIDGIVRVNVGDQVVRYDNATNKFMPDQEFARAIKGLGILVGRPGRDVHGRLWVTTEQGIHLFLGEVGRLQPVGESIPVSFQPYYFTFENSGVVWLHSSRRFARYDPSIPAPQLEPLRAVIVSVALPSSDLTLYPVNHTLPDLAFEQNTIVPRFLSTGNILSHSVAFDVKLEGTGQDWVSVGSAGSTIFNQLNEGRYTLLVRPRSGQQLGETATLAFTILPPWYRTVPAYLAGLMMILGAIYAAGWVMTYLERREKYRLENLVAQRTRELKATNARLGEQVEEIRTLSQAIQQSPVGVLIIRTDDTIVFANPKLCAFSGYHADELVGQSFHLLHESTDQSPATVGEFQTARQRGEPWHGQLATRSKNGRVLQIRTTASPLRNNQGEIHHYLLLVEDITESLAEQDRHARLEAQLVLAQKRESLGTLAGGIAHDFNNILTGILGYNELIQMELGDDSPVQQELLGIRAAGQRAKELVSQILSFTRQSKSQLQPLDLAQPVTEAMKLIRASTPSTIEIVPSLQSGLIMADPSQIHQIVLNLCTNAAHAMRGRPGRMEVTLDRISLNLVQASEISGLQAGSYLRLQVRDNGSGMNQDVLDRIFDPFFTTKDPGEGTGLGLPIVLSLVTSHHGGMRIRSIVGEGTTAELFFPITQHAKGDTTLPFPPPAGRQQEILVVDDEPMVTTFISVRLRQLGYLPTIIADPREALSALGREPNKFTALITDLTMPHMTGVELIRNLTERGHQIPPSLSQVTTAMPLGLIWIRCPPYPCCKNPSPVMNSPKPCTRCCSKARPVDAHRLNFRYLIRCGWSAFLASVLPRPLHNDCQYLPVIIGRQNYFPSRLPAAISGPPGAYFPEAISRRGMFKFRLLAEFISEP